MQRKDASLYQSKSLYLLVSLVLLILVAPFVDGTPTGPYLLDVLLSVMLLATANAASNNRWVSISALALALVASLLLLTTVADRSSPAHLVGLVLFVALCASVVVLGLRRIVLAPTVTSDIICASVGLYLLIGVAWSLSYVIMDTIDPDAFTTLWPDSGAGRSDYIYFSFATLTTLGYGDFAPGTPVARIWAIAEAVTGTLYIAVLVGRLVGLYRK